MRFITSVDPISSSQLHGFFVGWPDPPSPETHLAILRRSDAVVLAVDDESAQVVGFVNALSDGVLSAFIPLLEVLPAYQGRGIGSELVRRLLAQLSDLYAVDLLCDADVQPFYARLGLQPAQGMMLRRYERQAGPRGGLSDQAGGSGREPRDGGMGRRALGQRDRGRSRRHLSPGGAARLRGSGRRPVAGPADLPHRRRRL
ncbi:MAG: GNAT family N-acetyltransferase [Anaerolineae bacterium]